MWENIRILALLWPNARSRHIARSFEAYVNAQQGPEALKAPEALRDLFLYYAESHDLGLHAEHS